MKKLSQSGAIDIFLIPLILMTIMFVGAGGFAVWAYMGRQDYKLNVDEKVAAAVEVAKQETETAKDNEYAEKEKLPLKDYRGPAAYANVFVQYPKTWAAYVEEKSSNGGTAIDGYYHPGFVPGTQSNPSYALRVQVVNTSYSVEARKYESAVRQGKLRASVYIPAKVQTVTGQRLDGEIANNKKGSMILVPVRDKTLKIWTEAEQFIPDLNASILPNYTFEP